MLLNGFHGAYGHDSEIIVRYRSTNFNHIFNSGYVAGYYSYTGLKSLMRMLTRHL